MERQKHHGGTLGHNLVSLGFITEEDLGALLSAQYGVPAVNLAHLDVEPAIVRLIPPETARTYRMLPLSIWEENLTIAMANPTDVSAMDSIESITGYKVEPVVAREDSIMVALDKYY